MGVLLFLAAGCAAVPWHRHHTPLAPAVAPPDSVAAAASGPSDSIRAAAEDTTRSLPAPTPPHRKLRREATPAPARTSAPGDSSGVAGTQAPGAAVSPTPATGPLPVSVDLSVEERARLEAACRRDLAAADSLVAGLATSALSAEARDRLAAIRGFIAQSRDALDRGDTGAAANLAHKARLLAEQESSR